MAYQRNKTHPPLLPSSIISRKTLLQKLEASLLPSTGHPSATCNVVLLRAPAGYGKTTLLADFARRSRLAAGWYFLDQSDTYPPLFVQTLTTVLSQAFPSLTAALPSSFLETLVAELQAAQQAHDVPILKRYTTILAEHMTHPFLLCLCNYQEVNEVVAVRRLINHFLQHMPSFLTLAIESRSIPFLEFSPLIARRRLIGFGSNALGFLPQEIQEYAHLQQDIVLSEAEAAQLATSLEGWITGLLLVTPLGDASATLTQLSPTSPWRTSALISNYQTLLAYIRQEVFVREEPALCFLQETSVLSRLDAQGCNKLLRRKNAEAMLTHIERQGLFLTRVPVPDPSASPTYLLHPALRHVLAQDLRLSQPERATALALRAAELFRDWGENEQALIQAITAHAYPLAVEILIHYARTSRYNPHQEETLERWLHLFPEALRERHPALLLIRATLKLMQHASRQAASLLDQAIQQVHSASSIQEEERESIPVLHAEILIVQSTIAFQEGRYFQTRDLCRKALDMLPYDQTDLRFLALHRLGICYPLMGDYPQGLAYLQQALQWGERTRATRDIAAIHASLANSYSLMCNYALAEHHRVRAVTLCEQINDLPGKINNLIWTAILKQNTGAFQEAEHTLQNILQQAREGGLSSSEAYILFNIGANALDQSALPQALTALEESLSLARRIGDHRLADQCLCELVMVHLLLHEYTTVEILLAQTTVSTTEQSGYEAIGYELACATFLLYQGDVVQAAACLQALEPRAHEAHLKRVQIECLIRLAACYHHLEQTEQMETVMERVVQIVNQGYFEHIPLIELQRFPEFWRAVQHCSEHACLPSWRETSPEQEEAFDGSESNSYVMTPTVSFMKQSWSLEVSSATRLQLLAFGEPHVLIDGQIVTRWKLARSLELCFFLLNYQRPIRKEQLVEALWSDNEAYVDQTVRSTLYYLKKALGGECLLSQAGLYTLDLRQLYGENIWYDVAAFQHHWIAAREALKSECDKQAEDHLQAMINLYGGDYVQSFYSNWCIPHRDELRTQCLNALRELAHLVWKQDRWEESLHFWQRLVAFDPCDEEAQEGIIRCYMRLGKRNLAIQQYQRCKEFLQQELAIVPGFALQKLYQKLAGPGG
ncbi:MAG TPA: BTAD domain-containing putative transcriptional regulator [Ktedonobacteraceae bacterium]